LVTISTFESTFADCAVKYGYSFGTKRIDAFPPTGIDTEPTRWAVFAASPLGGNGDRGPTARLGFIVVPRSDGM